MPDAQLHTLGEGLGDARGQRRRAHGCRTRKDTQGELLHQVDKGNQSTDLVALFELRCFRADVLRFSIAKARDLHAASEVAFTVQGSSRPPVLHFSAVGTMLKMAYWLGSDIPVYLLDR